MFSVINLGTAGRNYRQELPAESLASYHIHGRDAVKLLLLLLLLLLPPPSSVQMPEAGQARGLREGGPGREVQEEAHPEGSACYTYHRGHAERPHPQKSDSIDIIIILNCCEQAQF